jgi:hypothetical protein
MARRLDQLNSTISRTLCRRGRVLPPARRQFGPPGDAGQRRGAQHGGRRHLGPPDADPQVRWC